MKDASLYHGANDVQRHDAQEVIQKFGRMIQWRSDGHDSLLDIGCGTGDVTMDFILPMMPKNFTKLVGVDIAEDMVRHSRQHHQTSKIFFEKLDIGNEIDGFLKKHPEGFDHITSFYCLNWVHDQRQVVKNLFDLLKTDGDCLLMSVTQHCIYDAYQELSLNPKWLPFMKHMDASIGPYNDCENPVAAFSELLRLQGFSKYDVHVFEKTYVYKGLDTFKKNMVAVNPFMENMTPNKKAEFLEDYMTALVRVGVDQKEVTENSYNFTMPYKQLIVYARK